MTKEELLKRLGECRRNGDTESAHADADKALIAYINDNDVATAFGLVDKWYA